MIQSAQISAVFEQRMANLENKVSKLDRMVVLQPQPLGQSQQPDGRVTGSYKPKGAEFTMTDFEEYRRDGDSWFSPHFYTHPNGYKMYLRIFADGSGTGKGTHLSLAVYLMQGEFDDQLKWPFQGNIYFKLVNQEKDTDHVIKILYSGQAPSERCERVLTNEPIENGWGMGQFVPLAELQPKYLKNDCIKLCVQKVHLY
jgi:hypothetical protein